MSVSTAVIDKDDIIGLILEACPSFEDEWKQHQAEYDQDLLYVAAGCLARHLLVLNNRNQQDCFAALAGVVERLHIEGTSWTKEFATIGILESIQNVWMNEGTDPKDFYRWLRPESRKWWSNLNDFWSGKAPYVGG